MLTKAILLTSAIAFSATSAVAGGLSPEIVEADSIQDEREAAPTASVNATDIVVGVLAALLIAAAVSSDDDD